MNNIPSSTVLSNELKLHDFKGSKISITYGDADINDGYSFARVNYIADDYKMNFWQDKPTFNIISEDFTLNDGKIWTQFNHGPNSGLNADMVDGHHAVDFKDRYGHHHFIHMFKTVPGVKKFVKIATLVPRKIGKAPDFNIDGSPPYSGVFDYSANGVNSSKLIDTAIIGQLTRFAEKTPENLTEWEYDVFHETDMLLEGVYNANLRANITLLKNGFPTTMDVHLGLFSDPNSVVTDGWEDMYKFFYISCHDEFLNFIEEEHPTTNDPKDSPLKKYSNPAYALKEKMIKSGVLSGRLEQIDLTKLLIGNKNEYLDKLSDGSIIDINEHFNKLPLEEQNAIIKKLDDLEAALTINGVEIFRDLPSPPVDQQSDDWQHIAHDIFGATITQPDPIDISNIPLHDAPDPSKDYKKQPEFEPFKHEGNSYQYTLDIMRLYHVDTLVEMVDGVPATLHKYELYLCVDEDTEVHVQPYMSSACLMGNFKKSISKAELPNEYRYMCPRSIYDKRYASVNHRHYDLEARLWALVEEVDKIWDMFDNYVPVDQGINNARRVMVTDDQGKIVAIPDTLIRKKDDRRFGDRVLTTNEDKEIGEDSTTVYELRQLHGMDFGIKGAFEQIFECIELIVTDIYNIIEVLDKLWEAIKALAASIDDVIAMLDNYVKKAGDTMTGHLVMDGCNIQLGQSNEKVALQSDTDNNHDFSLISYTGGEDHIPMFFTSRYSSKNTLPIAGGGDDNPLSYLAAYKRAAFDGPNIDNSYNHVHLADPKLRQLAMGEILGNKERRDVMCFKRGIAIDGCRIEVSNRSHGHGGYGPDIRPGDIRIQTSITGAPPKTTGEDSNVPIPVHPSSHATGMFIYGYCHTLSIYRWINAFHLNKIPAQDGDK